MPAAPVRPALPLLAAALVAGGCWSSGAMAEKAEPLAAGAVEDARRLVPYLTASGLEVVADESELDYADPQVVRRTSLDFGGLGACVVQTYRTAEDAEHFGPRSVNEGRDLRAPMSVNLLRGAPSPQPGRSDFNPTFRFGRQVALCRADAAVRRAFQALQDYAEAGA